MYIIYATALFVFRALIVLLICLLDVIFLGLLFPLCERDFDKYYEDYCKYMRWRINYLKVLRFIAFVICEDWPLYTVVAIDYFFSMDFVYDCTDIFLIWADELLYDWLVQTEADIIRLRSHLFFFYAGVRFRIYKIRRRFFNFYFALRFILRRLKRLKGWFALYFDIKLVYFVLKHEFFISSYYDFIFNRKCKKLEKKAKWLIFYYEYNAFFIKCFWVFFSFKAFLVLYVFFYFFFLVVFPFLVIYTGVDTYYLIVKTFFHLVFDILFQHLKSLLFFFEDYVDSFFYVKWSYYILYFFSFVWLFMRLRRRHLFHLVNPSPWPLLISLSVFLFVSGFGFYLHRIEMGGVVCLSGFASLVLIFYFWFRDIWEEATYGGHHTKVVKKGLILGFFLFLSSEVMLFFGFFWAFFNSALSPSIIFASEWPFEGISVISFLNFPLLNTLILIASGFAVTWAHRAVALRSYTGLMDSLLVAIFLGLLFIFFQVYEYFDSSFNLNDNVYGCTFFILTGLHGCHVIAGILFLIVSFIRFLRRHFTTKHYLGFVFAIWYWHFVDVIWIILFIVIYVWGSW
jgi:heme/copper-type cytochrome/quinol oxidase subunit 3